MLLNYLTIAARTLRKRWGPTLINVTGLAVGIAACLLIGFWVQHELSYDDFHPGADRTYRIGTDVRNGATHSRQVDAPAPLAPTLVTDVAGVETATQFIHTNAATVELGNRAFPNQQLVRADSLFLNVFGGFEMVRGSRGTALDDAQSVVVTESAAHRYFGRVDVVGETVSLRGQTRRITGVLADIPEASHVQFDIVGRLTVPSWAKGNWTANSFYTYARLVPGRSEEAFQSALNDIVRTSVAAQLQGTFGPSYAPLSGESQWRYFTQPLTRIHLESNAEDEIGANGSIKAVYAFSLIGFFILLIACINFMNLATARAAERSTEVGMRKALGAHRTQLAGQFLGEAFLTTLVAAGAALAITSGALPFFSTIAGTTFSFGDLARPSTIAFGLLIVAGVGLLAGSYPAFALSRFPPAALLKKSARETSGGRGRRLRQGLVGFQFAVTVVLIAGTLVATEQFSYIQDKRLGLDTDRVAVVERASSLGSRQASFVERIRTLPGVADASAGDPVFRDVSTYSFTPDDAPSSASVTLQTLDVGFRFADALGVEVVAGRSFEPGRAADSSAVLINREAARILGWTVPEGHRLSVTRDSVITYRVIGIVENFHYQSMRERVRPLVLLPGETPQSVYARLSDDQTTEALADLEAAWKQTAGDAPFQVTFLDQTYAELHRDTQRAGRLFAIFAALAVLIAGMGLFGLATHVVQRRAKEIGIRKALGATAPQIVALFSRQFLRLVGIAAAVALPIAYGVMHQWLQNFAYRIDLGAGLFVAAALLAGAVALSTVAFHAVRAARLDPVTTLQDH